ncbi:hypothetical protein [Pseudooceanicola algae]|uniref:Uncharacterized protein n=1 Tax=Pseudooceanicola algae TaxID=1537215 RepID=A0A418SKA1_9RHOB|nr:hypothetical protein [Pseudooceanicola algae]QPM89114.1 hypothetical protein PSAL_003240 [Pseudooceanicola algae]
MADDTNAAIQALIQQVSTLTETVEAQSKRLDKLHDFNGRVLDEKKDLQRKLADPGEQARRLSAVIAQEQEDRRLKSAGMDRYEKRFHLSRAEARDPAKYRAAKEAAEKAGATLQIVDPDATNDRHWRKVQKSEIAQTKTISLDDEHHRVRYVREDHNTGAGIVQRRLEAEKQGFKITTWRTPSDLPQHMQAKLHLMEKAHDANT